MEELFFNKYRLSIMVMLGSGKEVSYKELKSALKITDGNLASHLRKLEEAGLIEVRKFFEGRRPKTTYRITERGKKELEKFLNYMKKILEDYKKEVI